VTTRQLYQVQRDSRPIALLLPNFDSLQQGFDYAILRTPIAYTMLHIAYAVAQLGRLCASAGLTHWAAWRHVMCYPSRAHGVLINLGVPRIRVSDYPTNPTGLDGYCHSAWANHGSETRRPATCILFRYNGCLISWKTTPQLLSTAEALFSIDCYYRGNLAS
jgi:hypothetical protein